MKLYATVTSERASKGQGGNKFIEVKVTIERDFAFVMTVRRTNDIEDDCSTGWGVYDGNNELIHWVTDKDIEKGKKQKDEYCNECMATPCRQQ